MRKLKLQVQITVDGFVGGLNGEMDWISMNWGDDIKKYVGNLTDSVDTILLGRKLADGFILYWTSIKPDNPDYPFACNMVNKPKVVFTKTLENHSGANTSLAKGELTEEVGKLKKQDGKGIIVYGGASFVSSLIKNNLIDEYHLFVNPAVIGKGLAIFNELGDRMNLKLVQSQTFDCGISVNHFEPK